MAAETDGVSLRSGAVVISDSSQSICQEVSDSREAVKRQVEGNDRNRLPGAQAAAGSVCGAERGPVAELHTAYAP